MDSDDGFMIYRRFGYLQSRLLLEKQERLRRLEERLDHLDFKQTSEEGYQDMLRFSGLEPDLAAPRDELMKDIENAFLEYGMWRSTCSLENRSSDEYLSKSSADC